MLGVSDGMIVSLAFLTGTALNVSDMRIIIITGAAAVVSSASSMFFSGILAKRTEIDLYNADHDRELYEIENEPEEEKEEMRGFYLGKGLSASETRTLVSRITKNKKKWLEDMLLNELHIHKDSLGSPLQSGSTIGFSSLVGGLVPLAPYILIGSLPAAMELSILISCCCLFAVGASKGVATRRNILKSGGETLLVGIVAVLIVFEIGRLLAFA
jgi:predicted membrane protein (TIGR00267 family)